MNLHNNEKKKKKEMINRIKKKKTQKNNFRYLSTRIGTRVKNGRAFSIFPEVECRHRKPEE